MSRHYLLATSRTVLDGYYRIEAAGPTLCEFIAAADYPTLSQQVAEMGRIERMHLAEHGGEVSTWIDGLCVCTTIGNRRPIQQSIVNEGEPHEIEESVRRAVAASSALADQAAPAKHRRDERAPTHHPGQQVLFEVTP